MNNYVIVQANEKSLEKLLSYNKGPGHGYRVQIYINGEYYGDIFIDPKLLFKALYEAAKKGAEIKFFNFLDKTRYYYYKEFKGVAFLSDATMNELIKLGKDSGRYLTLKEIRARYELIGKELEENHLESKLDMFNRLNKIINNCRHAQLEYKMSLLSEKNTKSQQLQKQ